jgi:hypothetical protein
MTFCQLKLKGSLQDKAWLGGWAFVTFCHKVQKAWGEWAPPGDMYAMAITGYAICDYAMPAQNYATKWSPALCGYGNFPVH